MKTQIAKLVTGDFGNNTLTLKIESKEMIIKAGKYAIVPIDKYEKLLNPDLCKCVLKHT